jgi:hypothetical protein
MDLAPQSALMSRRGVALFAALALIGVLSLVVGGTLAAFRLAARSSGFAQTDAGLTAAADYAINTIVSDARQLGLDTLPLGVPVTVSIDVPGVRVTSAVVTATRLANGIAWIVADVADSSAIGGHRRVNVVAEWRAPMVTPMSALVSRGDVRVAAGVSFDSDTTGDADCRSSPSRAVTLAPGASLTAPPSVSFNFDARAADTSTYLLSASQLAALAAAGASVTRVTGDTTINGGSFSGILIVNGALTISGPFIASGLIVSQGPIVAISGGLTLTGAMMSFALPPAPQAAIDLGPAVIHYSRCAITAALRRAVALRPVRARSWAELF